MRLAIEGGDRTIGARLRGVVVRRVETADAVVFLEPATVEFVRQLLMSGKHVLLTAEPNCTRGVLSELLRERYPDTRLVLVNPDRYLPSRRLIREQVGGTIGEVGLVRLHRWQPLSDTSLLRDIDMILWLIGKTPDVVFALRAGRSVQVHLGFPGGAMALLDNVDGLPPGDGYRSLSVIGFSGAAYADDHHDVQLLYRGGRPQALRTEEGIVSTVAMIQDFVNRRAPEASVAAWFDVFAVADAVEESLRTGQAVRREGR